MASTSGITAHRSRHPPLPRGILNFKIRTCDAPNMPCPCLGQHDGRTHLKALTTLYPYVFITVIYLLTLCIVFASDTFFVRYGSVSLKMMFGTVSTSATTASRKRRPIPRDGGNNVVNIIFIHGVSVNIFTSL